MSRMIKLSKSDWLRIGREQGYLKKESQFISGTEAVYNQVGELHDMLEEMGFEFRNRRLPKIDLDAWKFADELQKFKEKLKGYNDEVLDEIYNQLIPGAAMDGNNTLTDRLIDYAKRKYGPKGDS